MVSSDNFKIRYDILRLANLKSTPAKMDFFFGGTDKKLDFLSDPIIPSELHRT